MVVMSAHNAAHRLHNAPMAEICAGMDGPFCNLDIGIYNGEFVE